MKIFPDKVLVRKVFAWGENCAKRPGGYVRTTLVGRRRGDATMMALLELVDSDQVAPEKTEK